MVAQCGPRGAYSLAPPGGPRLQLRTPVHLATPGGPFHGRYRHRPARPITCSGAQGTSSGGAAPAAAAVAAAEEQPNKGAAGSGASSSSTVAGSVEASARDLREEVEQLRTLLVQQAALLAEQQAAAARQQAETAALIAQQQETIRLLEGRFWESSMGKPDTSRGAPAAAGAAAAAAGPAAVAAAAAALSAELEVAVAPTESLQPGAEQVDDDPLSFMNPTIADRRVLGSYDARFHSTNWRATPRESRMLPRRIVLVRHAQSKGNVDPFFYQHTPDPHVPLTSKGWEQAIEAGEKIRAVMDGDGEPYKLFFYTSPYTRCKQTTEGILQAFDRRQLLGIQEEVQLREQDFGNFQDAEAKSREKAERMRYGRFFYRFPHGESGADVYDRMTIFQDHLVRDINAGRFGEQSALVLVTHGLAMRVFLCKWFHWTVDEFLEVWNPPNAEPIILDRITTAREGRAGGPAAWIHTKALYRLTDASLAHLVGCTEEMCNTSWLPRGIDSTRKYSTH